MSGEPVVMGRLGSAFGIRGEMKIRSLTQNPEDLFSYAPWYLRSRDGSWQEVTPQGWRPHGDGFVVSLAGIDSPEAARAYAGFEIGIKRESLPETGDGEIYLGDLIGCRVVGSDGSSLGVIREIMSGGATPVLRLAPASEDKAAQGVQELIPRHRGDIRHERLIPYVPDEIVISISLEDRLVRVSWTAEYFA